MEKISIQAEICICVWESVKYYGNAYEEGSNCQAWATTRDTTRGTAFSSNDGNRGWHVGGEDSTVSEAAEYGGYEGMGTERCHTEATTVPYSAISLAQYPEKAMELAAEELNVTVLAVRQMPKYK